MRKPVVACLLWLLAGSLHLVPPAVGAQGGVAPEVLERLHDAGHARVIVELDLVPGFVPEGLLHATAAAAQRAEVAAAGREVLARLAGRSARVVHRYASVPLLVLEIGGDALPDLVASPRVRRVVADTLNAPLLATSVPLIEGDQLWARGVDGTGITVGIVDTGVDGSHPFLAGKVVAEACFSSTASGSVTVCPNGASTQTGAGAAVPCGTADCWHGTHVAGIAAGNGAQAGQTFSGVAKNASIIAVQVFSRFNDTRSCGAVTPPCVLAYTSDIIKGLEHVYGLRASRTIAAANLSLGGGLFTAPCDGEPEKSIIDTLRAAGIATVIAAGNDGSRSALSSPGCISSAVSVGSTTKTAVLSSFSNVASFLSLLAPGSAIVSSVPGGGYATASGTSMATPHVTGALALLKQADPGATVSQAVAALQQTGLDVPDLRSGGTVTRPLIRASQALSVLLPPTVSGVTPPSAAPGATLAATIAGTMFAPAATVGFGAGVTVNSVTFVSAQQLTVGLTVSSTAATGLRTVTVTNPGGSSGAAAGAFTVQVVTSPADLAVTAVDNVPGSVLLGATFTVNDTIVNRGGSSAAPSTTRYYLSTDTSWSSGDVMLKGARSVSSLPAGGTSSGSTTLSASSLTRPGVYYVLACADDLFAVAESNEANNCKASATMTTLTAPDLVTTAVGVASSSVPVGGSLVISDRVVNQGNGGAGTSFTRYVLSLDDAKSANDVSIGVRAVPALAPLAASSGTVTVTLSAGVAAGTYRLFACADDNQNVYESAETNNCAMAPTPIVIGSSVPDLVESSVTIGASHVAPGEAVSVTDTVTNQGSASAAASTTRYYLSLDGLRSGDDVLLAPGRAIATLAPGATSTSSVTVTVPVGTSEGTYVIVACADDLGVVTETSEANNCLASGSALVVAVTSGAPDLVPTALTGLPVSVAIGDAFTLGDTVTNRGGGTAGSSLVHYFLSTDALRGGGDILLKGARTVPALAGGASSSASTSVSVAASTPVGLYYVLVCADDLFAVAESSEVNNCLGSTSQLLVIAPDLVETSVSNPPASAAAGTSFAVTDTVLNQGTGAARTFYTRYYLSTDRLAGAGDILLGGYRAVGGLAVGASSSATVSVTVPAGTLAGLYHVIVCADDIQYVYESSELNNCLASATQVAVGP